MRTSCLALALLPAILVVMAASVVPSTDNPYDLIVTEPPSFVRSYVIPDLSGQAVVLINDAIRAPINNLSSGGAFSLLQLNAQNYIRSGYGDLYQSPPHYHSRFHETFFCYKGEVTLWANGEARMLTAQDFGSMPTMQNHSYSFTEPDSTLLAFITPGGFEHFYWNVSVPLVDPTNAPFAPDIHTHFLESTFEAAIGPVFDVIPIFQQPIQLQLHQRHDQPERALAQRQDHRPQQRQRALLPRQQLVAAVPPPRHRPSHPAPRHGRPVRRQLHPKHHGHAGQSGQRDHRGVHFRRPAVLSGFRGDDDDPDDVPDGLDEHGGYRFHPCWDGFLVLERGRFYEGVSRVCAGGWAERCIDCAGGALGLWGVSFVSWESYE
ncbi:hypothetical protein LTR12_003732 [Friedmanniomyces endolithicus]|nr:hypothetical protein LTR12_003732 [Friedmanniomyces endolithicus]